MPDTHFQEYGLQTYRPESRTDQSARFNSASTQSQFGLRTHVHGAPAPQQQQLQNRAVPITGIFEGFQNTCTRWGLDESEQIILLGYPPKDFMGELMFSGFLPPRTRDVRDRIGYVLAISLGLGSLFNEDKDAEKGWINSPHGELGGMAPRSLMLQGRMLDLITVSNLVLRERAI